MRGGVDTGALQITIRSWRSWRFGNLQAANCKQPTYSQKSQNLIQFSTGDTQREWQTPAHEALQGSLLQERIGTWGIDIGKQPLHHSGQTQCFGLLCCQECPAHWAHHPLGGGRREGRPPMVVRGLNTQNWLLSAGRQAGWTTIIIFPPWTKAVWASSVHQQHGWVEPGIKLKSNKSPHWGSGEGQLLATAEEEGWELGLANKKEQLQGVSGRHPCHCSTTTRCSGVKGVEHQRAAAPGWPNYSRPNGLTGGAAGRTV